MAGEGQCSTPFPIIRRHHGVISVPRWNGLLYRPSGLPTSRLGDTTPARGPGPTGIQCISVLHQLGGTRRGDRGQGPGMGYCQSTKTEGFDKCIVYCISAVHSMLVSSSSVLPRTPASEQVLKGGTGTRPNIKMSSYQYNDPHVKDKTVVIFNMEIPIYIGL